MNHEGHEGSRREFIGGISCARLRGNDPEIEAMLILEWTLFA
jgi:hypothetical protein